MSDRNKTEPCIDCGENVHPQADIYELTNTGRRCVTCIIEERDELKTEVERLREVESTGMCVHGVVLEKIKLALRIIGTGSYVDFARWLRNEHSRLTAELKEAREIIEERDARLKLIAEEIMVRVDDCWIPILQGQAEYILGINEFEGHGLYDALAGKDIGNENNS
jgi:hypothetical protein